MVCGRSLVNGTNAAKNTTATFTRAGTYTLQATIKDADAQIVTSTVTVTFNQTLTSVVVSPASATVAPNGTRQLTATARDQFAQAMTTQPSFAWSVSGGGTISATGLFTAGAAAGGPFTVTAHAGGKSGTASVTVSSATAAIRINCGGGAVGSFAADQFFSGGSAFTSTSTVNTAGVANAAPAAVYQSERFGNHSYTFGGLTPGGAYTVRLHFAEIWWTSAGARVFNVSINGAAVLTNFDIFATAGAFQAVVRDFAATANGSGQIVIQYTTVRDNAKSSGIEILGSAGAPPTVATPAAASPNPATGTTTNLSVLGADDGGEPSLTYTWSTTGTPPAPVTFGAYGTNGAKNTTATFTKAGSYGLLVTIRDTNNATVTSSVTVTVNQTLTSIAVSPSSASVAVGATQAFAATARDQFGNNLATQPSFTWTVSGGGSISGAGLFTAGGAPGGPFTVTAASGGKSGTASVTVTSSQVTLFRVNSGGPAVGSFSADQLVSGGNAYVSTNTIDLSGASNPAPAAVYQSERWGNFTYTFSGLAAGASHTVRLHFAEIWWSGVGQRTFNVVINGAQVLANFDIVAAAGGPNRAIVRQFTANADAAGQITIQFTAVIDYAKSSGIEILKP